MRIASLVPSATEALFALAEAVLAAADGPQEEREQASLVDTEEEEAEPCNGPWQPSELGQHVGDPVVAAEREGPST
jgi:hypothetical protein